MTHHVTYDKAEALRWRDGSSDFDYRGEAADRSESFPIRHFIDFDRLEHA